MPTDDPSYFTKTFSYIRTAAESHGRVICTLGIVLLLVLAGMFSESARSFIALLPEIFTWPISILILIIYLASSATAATRLSNLFGRFGTVKLLGSEVTFTSEGARQLFSNADEAFNDFKVLADREFKRQVQTHALRDSVSRVFDQDDEELSRILSEPGFRCTVHIEDILFKDTLYQLLDYYPKPDGSAGRRFSIRFGMIGLTWRTARHQGHWDAADRKSDELIRTWGMTRDEASDPSRQKPSYLCVLLKTAKNAPAGVLFMDSSAKNAFGRNDDEVTALAEHISKKCETMGFQQALENVVVELRKYDTGGIQIHA